jgi:diguanylate cyclase (GGDEF)-like protein
MGSTGAPKREMTPSASRAWLLVAALLIGASLVGGLAYSVVHSQARARSDLEEEFGRRASSAARLTSAALASTTPQQFRETFDGPASGLVAAMRTFQSFDPDPRAAVLDADGRPLVTWPIGSAVGDLARTPTVRAALRGRLTVSDISTERPRTIMLAVPFDTASGRRVGLQVLPADVIDGFASAYLAGAPAIAGGDGYLIDGSNRVLGSSTGIEPGRVLPERALTDALRTGASGDYGDRRFAAASMPATRWRVVLTAPRAELLAPVEGSTERTAWLLFAAFVVALLALAAVALLALRRSAEIAGLRERERAARRLAHEQLHDALTGLPNHALFLDRADQALAVTRGRAVAVLFVDLDRFKRINESLGHASGDVLLKMVGERLAGAMRPVDTTSRFGGDEFLILCPDVDGLEDALEVAARVSAAFAQPFQVGGRSVPITCCIGIAGSLGGAPDGDAAALVLNADAALNRAKSRGPGSTDVFEVDVHGGALARLDTELALRAAIDAGQLRVHYQPIVALPDGAVRGVEAVVRWERPDAGLVPPAVFIGIAEESGLIAELGHHVLRTAMTDVAAWRSDGLIGPEFVLSVNVSAHQLSDGELPAAIAAELATWPLKPEQLWLELTESSVAHEPDVARRGIEALSALGVRVAIDDFGIGQSSLEQLVNTLSVDILKLDRSFIARLEDPRERAVAAAIAPMASALRMTAVVEGVETAAQADELAALGYPLAQGFHFGRPVEAARLRRILVEIARRPVGA